MPGSRPSCPATLVIFVGESGTVGPLLIGIGAAPCAPLGAGIRLQSVTWSLSRGGEFWRGISTVEVGSVSEVRSA